MCGRVHGHRTKTQNPIKSNAKIEKKSKNKNLAFIDIHLGELERQSSVFFSVDRYFRYCGTYIKKHLVKAVH